MAKPVKPIGNPGSWALDAIAGSSRYVANTAGEIGSRDAPAPDVANLRIEDLGAALRKGWDDFAAFRSDVIFVVVLYPIIGICLAAFAFNRDLMHMIFPFVSGFALLGPVAAVGLYEMSRRRERGESVGWGAALEVLGSPAIGAILTVGFYLVFVFVAWLIAAYLIYEATLGPEPPVSAAALLDEVFTTGPGWTLLVVGCAIGFVFAAVVLAFSVVSIPPARPPRGRAGRGGDVAAAHEGKPGAGRRLGPDRRGPPGDRDDSALSGPDLRPARPRPCDLAPLPPRRALATRAQDRGRSRRARRRTSLR